MAKVSCICPTFNRATTGHLHLLEEAVYSFCKQEHDDKELIIVNDCPEQTLIFRHPQVKILNVGKRFPTLGEKLNFAIANSDGKYICPWEDDDISLPNRLSLSLEHIEGRAYWKPNNILYCESGKTPIVDGKGVMHHASIFLRSPRPPYQHVSGNQDQLLDADLRALDNSPMVEIENGEIFYLYRWGVSPYHLSGVLPHQDHYDKVGKLDRMLGEFLLNPHWKKDYKKWIMLPGQQ